MEEHQDHVDIMEDVLIEISSEKTYTGVACLKPKSTQRRKGLHHA